MARKSLTIKLYISELIYDFQNKSHLIERSRLSADMDVETVSNIQASDADEDNNQALRSIQTALGQLQEELGEYVSGTEYSADNELMKENDISIKLSLPTNYNLGLKDALASGIHDYIVNRILTDWLLITNPKDAEAYAGLSAVSMKSIHELLNRRERPKRN